MEQLREGTKVKIVPNLSKSDKQFIDKYDSRIATITCVNPISGYLGYGVSVWDYDETINLDSDEIVVMK